MTKIKNTSYEYGSEYQNNQVIKYKNRANNHWKHRLDVYYKLLDNKALDSFKGKEKSDITVVDIGCSIGTFALEAARNGYNSIGIDFDNEAITIAKKLAIEESVNAKFICGDISNDIHFNEKIDIAVCFDIFEHLHDDELGSLLQAIKKRLSKNGVILYHTFPTFYDYIFFGKSIIHYPLIPFKFFSVKFFLKVTKLYSVFIDFFLILFKNKNYKELIKNKPHCNLLSKEKLNEILNRAGFKNESIELSQLFKFKQKVQNRFRKHPISFRNLYGIAVPQKK